MKSLKNIITLFIIVAGVLSSGCKKALELRPYNSFVEDNAFTTPERCLLALNGVYDAAQSGDYDPLNGTAHSVRGYPFGAAALEQSEMRGEDMVNIATFFQITYQSTYSPVSPNNVNMWINLYLLINKANLSIDGFKLAQSKGVITAAVAAQYEAECRFLRAMAHHELLINFCRPYLDGNGNKPGVPYHDYAVSSDPASLERLKTHPRELVSVCYDKILADLDFAEANLPASPNVVRATKAASIALKMKVKMHKGDWSTATGVLFEGNKLVPAAIAPVTVPNYWTTVVSPTGGYRLELTPNGAFLNNSTLESIFSIKNDALDNTGVNAALSQMFGPNVPGRGLVAISPVIYNSPAWRCDDKRRDTTGSLPFAPTTTNMIVYGKSNANTNSFFTRKYIDYVNQADYTPLIRYAEVLLMQAEGEARLAAGISQRAIDLLNVVRNRSIPNPGVNQYVIASFADKNALIKAILDERRIEFVAEGKRWGDIHRLVMDPVFSTNGIPAKVANGFSNNGGAYGCGSPMPPLATLAIPYADYRFLWPIPQDELTQNPIITPNPGY